MNARTSWLEQRLAQDAAMPTLRDEVLGGLRRSPKRLSPKFFYDARGSALFEQICDQPEYYLTRAELELLDAHADDIAAALGEDVLLIEYGSGSARKTARLIEAMQGEARYVPVEISATALDQSVDDLRALFPALDVAPICADFTSFQLESHDLPAHARRVVYFPGSTLGNFETADAVALLKQMRRQIGANGAALIGIDLRKDKATIESAYNDAAGVTAAFTLNMLARFNRELQADFELAHFAHRARYNVALGRIETHIVSHRQQRIRVADTFIHFDADEAMLVEYSYKYSPPGFAHLAAQAGLHVQRIWTDAQQRFSVQLLVPR
ncbi:L-histidine N(alpha)-methyltransferase [Solimonas marina]|uniref:L-histidine N(Alpha)-methyltransferase n=1 Tax=Solimonas marina TaxID=2714601 RepID=A0A969WA52_9GAMM|nr:L-histidine N(alpha)-methyltransferase [Solimonas marina]NKF23477.1 L-histidine N(alpha)-methyltransferase [Solimonas marina]